MRKRKITDIRPQLKLRLSEARAELFCVRSDIHTVEKQISNINQQLVQEDWLFDAPHLQ
jgi:hypothetical protein